MDSIGFKVTKAEHETQAKLLLAELDSIVTDETRTVLQVIMNWDEYATIAPALEAVSRERERGKVADYCAYSVGNIELPPPEPNLLQRGSYKGVDIYVRNRPVPNANIVKGSEDIEIC